MIADETMARVRAEAERESMPVAVMLDLLLCEALTVRIRARNKPGSIYALVDPRAKEIRYVGQTRNNPKHRLITHLARPVNPRMQVWLDDLKANGLRPELVILERPACEYLKEREQHWMVEMARRKQSLCNSFTADMLHAWES